MSPGDWYTVMRLVNQKIPREEAQKQEDLSEEMLKEYDSMWKEAEEMEKELGFRPVFDIPLKYFC